MGECTWGPRRRVGPGASPRVAGEKAGRGQQPQGVDACHRLNLPWPGKTGPREMRAEPRSEPDSGNPTVRDRRGACGVMSHGSRTEGHVERRGETTGPYRV